MKHLTKNDDSWFDSRYSGEDRDDGAANELSIVPDPNERRLDVLLSNVGFDGRQYDNTFSLTRDDTRQLIQFLQQWLNDHPEN